MHRKSERCRQFIVEAPAVDRVSESLRQVLDLSRVLGIPHGPAARTRGQLLRLCLRGGARSVASVLPPRCCASAAGARSAGSARLHVEMFRNAPDYIMVVWVHFVLPLLIGALLARAFRVQPVRIGDHRPGIRLQRLLRRDVSRRHRGDPARPNRSRPLLRHVRAPHPAGASFCRRSCGECCPSRSTSSSRCSRRRRSSR